MKKNKEKMNGKMFIVLALIVIVVIGLFTYFIYLFTKYDKTEYEVAVGSVLYNSDLEYIKVAGDAYITQKPDRNYYLYEEKDGKKHREKIGKNAVIFKEGDMHVYIYGTVYQVLKSGDVDTLTGETKAVIANSTKFFKLEDRRYLIVDSEIKTIDSDVLDTNEYLIVNIDKKGKPSFSNHLVDFKTTGNTTLMTSLFNFDIANEKLIYGKKEMDLKNIIGSSNEYEPPKAKEKDYTDEKLEAIQNNISDSSNAIVGYYDQYFSDVVSSVNNLTQSVLGVHNNTVVSLSKEEVYYDFDKWIALKSINAKTGTIDISYTIFDPTNEYQTVYLICDGPAEPNALGEDEDYSQYTLTKTESSLKIRDLKPNTQYQLTLAYKLVGALDPTIEETIVATTKKDKYELKVPKISYKNGSIYLDYQVVVDPEYKFTKALITFNTYETMDLYDASKNDPSIYRPTNSQSEEVKGEDVNKDGIYEKQIVYTGEFGYINELILNGLQFCSTETGECHTSNIEVVYKFFSTPDESAEPEVPDAAEPDAAEPAAAE